MSQDACINILLHFYGNLPIKTKSENPCQFNSHSHFLLLRLDEKSKGKPFRVFGIVFSKFMEILIFSLFEKEKYSPNM